MTATLRIPLRILLAGMGRMSYAELAQAGEIAAGDTVTFDLTAGRVRDLTTGRDYAFPSLPPHLLALIEDGGLVPHLMRRFSEATA